MSLAPEVVTSSTKDFEDIVAMQGLLDYARNHLGAQGQIAAGFVEPITRSFTADEDSAIEVVPKGKSREIPLKLEVFTTGVEGWRRVSPDSSRYEELIGLRNGFDQFFRARTAVLIAGEVYVYSDDSTVRVRATTDAALRIVSVT